MATPTLNELIASAISGAEEASTEVSEDVETVQENTVSVSPISEDVEKIASALEFIARRGVETFSKEAAHDGGSLGNVGTNMHTSKPSHTQKPVRSAPGVTQASMSGDGQPETNDSRPGGGKAQADLGDKEKGDHHSSLASNEAAQNFTKKEHSERVAPALSSLLDAKPFADPKVKENLSAASSVDPNVHSKSAHAHLVREALAARISEAQNQENPS